MKKTLSINNGFSQMADSLLLSRSYQILAAMTNNPNFTTPTPTVAVVSDAINEFYEALNLCKDSDRLQIAIKNQKRVAVIGLLHQWADYVLFISQGDSAVAMSSNFTLGKTPSPKPPIKKPENFRIENGTNPGELVSKINRVESGVSYLHQFATDEMLAQDTWQSVPSSKTTCILSNLTPGTKYNCRVAVLGAKDQLLYSDIVSRIAA